MVGRNGQRYHFSVDDVFDALLEVSEGEMELFAHPFFRFLGEIHARFDTRIDLYLFLEKRVNGGARHLREVSAANLEVLQGTPWLRFGPHGLDYETPPHAQSVEQQQRTFEAIYAEILRFAGPDKGSRWVRLHYFSEPLESSSYLNQRGVESVLLTDKQAVSYRLPEDSRSLLARDGVVQYGPLELRRSHFRMENLAADQTVKGDLKQRFDPILSDSGYLSLFTHEVDLARSEVRQQTLDCLQYARSNGIESL